MPWECILESLGSILGVLLAGCSAPKSVFEGIVFSITFRTSILMVLGWILGGFGEVLVIILGQLFRKREFVKMCVSCTREACFQGFSPPRIDRKSVENRAGFLNGSRVHVELDFY